MKKIAPFSLSVLMPVLVLLASCASMDLKLESPETDYNKYPLVSGRNILKPEIGVNGYTFALEKSISKETDLPSVNLLNLIFGDDSSYSGGRFAFLKGSQKLCTVYVYQKSNMNKSGKLSMGTVSRYAVIEKGKSDVKEYELVDKLGSAPFLSVNENDASIDFAYYREPGNKLAGIVSINTAYKISVNGKPYGILSLNRNAALYELKSAALPDGALKDAVMLWVLAVYEDYSNKSAP